MAARARRRGVGLAFLAALAGLAALGCAQARAPARFEKLEGAYAFIRGAVPSEGWEGGPIIVVLSREAAQDEPNATDFRLLYQPGAYWFYAQPADYQLAAYEHPKGHPDLYYDPGQPAVRVPAPLTLEAGRRYQVDLGERFSRSVRLPERFDLARTRGTTRLRRAWQQLGEVVSLDDPRLSLEAGRAGLVAPEEYVEKTQVGLYFLEPYSPAKVPVLFLHGLGGAPVQFEALLAGLDRERFQPWLFSYPSLFPVGLVGRLLNDMMNVLHERHRYTKAHVVAHSLGGLVGRAYIRAYAQNASSAYLDRFLSIATPWGGQSAARFYHGTKVKEPGAGASEDLESDPTTDPETRGYVSYVDLAPGSGFLRHLFAEPLPRGVHFHLVFGYHGRRALGPGDGVVSLGSQLRLEAQREASGQRGFDESHMGLLQSPEVVAYLREVLEAAER